MKFKILRYVFLSLLLLAAQTHPAAAFTGLMDVADEVIRDVVMDQIEAVPGKFKDKDNWKPYGEMLGKGDLGALAGKVFEDFSAENLAKEFLKGVLPDVVPALKALETANTIVTKGTSFMLEMMEDRQYADFHKRVLTYHDPAAVEKAYNDYMETYVNAATTYDREKVLDAKMKSAKEEWVATLRAEAEIKQRRQEAEDHLFWSMKHYRFKAREKAWEAVKALEAAGLPADGASVRRWLKEPAFQAEVARKIKETPPPVEKRPPEDRPAARVDEELQKLPSTIQSDIVPNYGLLLSDARQAVALVLENQISAKEYLATVKGAQEAARKLDDQYQARVADGSSQQGQARHAALAAAYARFQEDLKAATANVAVYAESTGKRLKEIVSSLQAAETPRMRYEKMQKQEAAAPVQLPSWMDKNDLLASLVASDRERTGRAETPNYSLAELRSARETMLEAIQKSMDREIALQALQNQFQPFVEAYRAQVNAGQKAFVETYQKNTALAELGGVQWIDFANERSAIEWGDMLIDGGTFFSPTTLSRLQAHRLNAAAQSAEIRRAIEQNEKALPVVEAAIGRETPLMTLPSSSFHPGGRLDKPLADALYEAVARRFQPVVDLSQWLGPLGAAPDGNPVAAVSVYGSEQAKKNLANFKSRLPAMQKSLSEHRAVLAQARTSLREWEALKIREREESLEKSEKTLGEEFQKIEVGLVSSDYLNRVDVYRQAHRLAMDWLRGVRSWSYLGTMSSILENYEKRIAELEAYEKEAIAYFSGLSVPPPPDYDRKASRYAPVASNLPNLPFKSVALESVYQSWTERLAAWRPTVKPPTPREVAPEERGIKPEDRPKITQLRIARRAWLDLDGVVDLFPEDLESGQIQVTGSLGGRFGFLTSWRMPDGSYKNGVTRLEVNVNRSGWSEIPLYQGDTVELPWKYNLSPREGEMTLAFRLNNLGYITSDPADCPPLKIRYSTVPRQDKAKENLKVLQQALEQKDLNGFMRQVSDDYYGGDDLLRDQLREFFGKIDNLQISFSPRQPETTRNQVVIEAAWSRRGQDRQTGQPANQTGEATFLFDRDTAKLRGAKGTLPWVLSGQGPAGEKGLALPVRRAKMNEHLAFRGAGAGFDFEAGQVIDCGAEDVTWDRREDESPTQAIISHKGLIDLGAKDINDIRSVPESGYMEGYDRVKLAEGHTYAVRTKNGRYGLLSVESVEPQTMSFQWKYQPDGSPHF